MSIKIPNDAIATVSLVFTDLEGHTLAGHPTNTSVAVSDPALASAALTSDGQWVQITPLLAGGAGSVVYTDADDNNITASLDFEIVTPTPNSVAFNESSLVLTPNPSPPAGAPGGPTP